MKSFFAEIAGGLAVIVVAAALGLAHNAVRGNSIPLIPGANAPDREAPAEQKTGNPGSSDAGNRVIDDIILAGTATAEQLEAIMGDPAVVIVDARSPEEYEEARIAGAINVPYDRMPEYYQGLIDRVPMEAVVVVYCQGPDCDFSDQLATELRIMGYVTVITFPGGWEHWEAAGYPAEGSKVKS